MSGWTEIFLAVIAVATLAIAIVQIAVLVAAGIAARRVGRLIDQIEQELRPLADHVHSIARDASRAAALATAQVERADHLFADFARRVDQTLTIIQDGLLAPVREGRAVFRALSAALAAIRELRREARARQGRSEDEDALFI